LGPGGADAPARLKVIADPFKTAVAILRTSVAELVVQTAKALAGAMRLANKTKMRATHRAPRGRRSLTHRLDLNPTAP
jgi:hypothetical protein